MVQVRPGPPFYCLTLIASRCFAPPAGQGKARVAVAGLGGYLIACFQSEGKFMILHVDYRGNFTVGMFRGDWFVLVLEKLFSWVLI